MYEALQKYNLKNDRIYKCISITYQQHLDSRKHYDEVTKRKKEMKEHVQTSASIGISQIPEQLHIDKTAQEQLINQ